MLHWIGYYYVASCAISTLIPKYILFIQRFYYQGNSYIIRMEMIWSYYQIWFSISSWPSFGLAHLLSVNSSDNFNKMRQFLASVSFAQIFRFFFFHFIWFLFGVLLFSFFESKTSTWLRNLIALNEIYLGGKKN